MSTSCRRRRERTCMCTSPAATSGRLNFLESFSSDCSLARSFGPQCSSAAIHALPRKRSASHGASAKSSSGRPEHEGSAAVKRLEVRPAQGIVAFLAAAPAGGDQARDRAVRAPVGGEQHQLAILEAQLGAEDQRQAAFLRRLVRAHRAGERAFVGQRERAVAERVGALDQLLRVRGAAQEAEVGKAVQLGVIRQRGHAGTIRPSSR